MNPDLQLFRLINGVAGQNPWLDGTVRFLANDYVITTALVTVLFFLWFSRDERVQAAVLRAALALFVANAIVKLFNLVWYRPRPFTYNDVNLLFYHPSDSSFPSNVTATVFALAWVIWLALPDRRRYGALMLVGAALLGLGRIYLGVHYPFDILGGALVGMVAGWLVEQFAGLLRPLTHRLATLARRVGLA